MSAPAARWPLQGCRLTTLSLGVSSSPVTGRVGLGDRIFLSPIVGNDAFPDNAASITTRGSNYEVSLLPELEKQLSDNSSMLFTGGWSRINPASPQQTIEGASDLSIWFRQAAFKSAQHELEITVSPFLVVPIGNRQILDQGYMH